MSNNDPFDGFPHPGFFGGPRVRLYDLTDLASGQSQDEPAEVDPDAPAYKTKGGIMKPVPSHVKHDPPEESKGTIRLIFDDEGKLVDDRITDMKSIVQDELIALMREQPADTTDPHSLQSKIAQVMGSLVTQPEFKIKLFNTEDGRVSFLIDQIPGVPPKKRP